MCPRSRTVHDSASGLRIGAWWPIAVALSIRIAVWLVVPTDRFASDEDSYYNVATSLITTGQVDLFWPPMTPWLIAALRVVLRTDHLAILRLVWIILDVGCVVAVTMLARRVADRIAGAGSGESARIATAIAAGYALYLPAISFAQFVTSETLALLQVLLILVLLTGPIVSLWQFAGAGVLGGTLVLTRPSVLPLLVFLPLTVALTRRDRRSRQAAFAFVTAASLIVAALLVRNYRYTGEITVARNSAYNLYIGNRDMYAEDLNLLQPRATAEQIEFRRQMWSGELVYPSQPAPDLQREALAWIGEHPGTFVLRSAGRLARVFVPRTDVIELAGGEQRAGIWSPSSLLLMAVANLQWGVILFGGLAGLVSLWRLDRYLGGLLLSVVIGALPLCMIAIAKPRYSFVFDPLLIVGTGVMLGRPRDAWDRLTRGDRLVLGLALAFVIWGWAAWAIFAISSRSAL
jgi:hypothetical protein